MAGLIWQLLGVPTVYVEPFFGSGAVFLSRPAGQPRHEIINDADGFVANFWRAVKCDPAAVARHADHPIHELDLLARNRWLCDHRRKPRFLARMAGDAEYFDARIAGRWAWCLSAWIGSGCCEGEWSGDAAASDCAALKKPRLVPNGIQAASRRNRLPEVFADLGERLREAIVLCGDWSRCFCPTLFNKPCLGIFLDPPYDHGTGRDATLYRVEKSTTADVQAFCLEHGQRPNVRIVLAGFDGEYRLPGWQVIGWSRPATYLSTEQGLGNCGRERLWISPHCLPIRIPRAARGHAKSAIWRCRSAR